LWQNVAAEILNPNWFDVKTQLPKKKTTPTFPLKKQINKNKKKTPPASFELEKRGIRGQSRHFAHLPSLSLSLLLFPLPLPSRFAKSLHMATTSTAHHHGTTEHPMLSLAASLPH
jgi:hypothetical protein